MFCKMGPLQTTTGACSWHARAHALHTHPQVRTIASPVGTHVVVQSGIRCCCSRALYASRRPLLCAALRHFTSMRRAVLSVATTHCAFITLPPSDCADPHTRHIIASGTH